MERAPARELGKRKGGIGNEKPRAYDNQGFALETCLPEMPSPCIRWQAGGYSGGNIIACSLCPVFLFRGRTGKDRLRQYFRYPGTKAGAIG